MSDKLNFTLTEKGLKIGKDDIQMSLLTSTGDTNKIEQGENASVKMDYKIDDNINSFWTLEHEGENLNDPYFFVDMTYGDIRPRLAYQIYNP